MLLTDLVFPRTRPAGADDDAFLKTLYASTRADLAPLAANPVVFGPLIDMQWRAQRAAYRAGWPDALDLIVEDDQGAAGRLLVDMAARQWRLVDIALLPRARSRGYGSALLRALQDGAQAAGAALVLNVRRDNLGAQRLYASLGFAPIGGDAVTEQMRWQQQ